MAIASAPMPYNTLIGPDYREENVYPEEHPGLVIIHDSPDEKAKAHWHPGLEFVYSSHGSCPFIVDGQEMPPQYRRSAAHQSIFDSLRHTDEHRRNDTARALGHIQ